MNIQFSKAFEKQFERYDKKLQGKIYEAICKIPEGDIKQLKGNYVPPLF